MAENNSGPGHGCREYFARNETYISSENRIIISIYY